MREEQENGAETTSSCGTLWLKKPPPQKQSNYQTSASLERNDHDSNENTKAELFRGFSPKRGLSFRKLAQNALFCLFLVTNTGILPSNNSLLTHAQITCPAGYTESTVSGAKKCTICPAGSKCPDASTVTACNAGTYSEPGATTCTTCPSGLICPDPTQPPAVCPQGKKTTNAQTCVNCSNSQNCGDPTTVTSCASTEFLFSKVSCEPCPAGKTCNGSTSATNCNAGNNEASPFGTSSCVQPKTMEFMASAKMAVQTCPANTFQFSTKQSACAPCTAGKNCAASAATQTSNISITSCSGTTAAAKGDPNCQDATSYPGYILNTSVASYRNALNFDMCNVGEYVNSNSCTQCPQNKECTLTGATNCPSTKYALAGWGTCANIPFGSYKNYGSANGYSGCSNTQTFDPATSSCVTCPAGVICDPVTGTQSVCQTGQYLDSSTTPRSCKECTEGKVCADGVNRPNVAAGSVTGTSHNESLKCPGGMKCTNKNLSSVSECTKGQYSLPETTTCKTDKDFILGKDLQGSNCPASSYQDSASRLFCKQSENDKEADGSGATSSTPCDPEKTAWFGNQCQTCTAGANAMTMTKCSYMEYFNRVYCAPNKDVSVADGTCSTPEYEPGAEYIQGFRKSCDKGKLHTGAQITSNAQKTCLDCADLTACASNGAVTGCWGQGLPRATYEAMTGLELHDWRIQDYEKQVCMDCDNYGHRNGICTFQADYFTNHVGDMLTCPFQTADRTVTRFDYPTSNQADYYTARGKTDPGKWPYSYRHGTDPVTYTSKNHYFNPENGYEYPYCKTDTSYFTYTVLDDAKTNQDDSEVCSIYEHRSPNYGQCEPNIPGFGSITATDSPTNKPIGQGTGSKSRYFSRLEQDGGTTSIVLDQCPQYFDVLAGYDGGNSPEMACFQRGMGECVDNQSDFCHAGGDFKCPAGWVATASKNTLNDCQSCPVGNFCPDSTTTTACTAGYLCPALSSEEKSFPTQPGSKVTANAQVDCAANKYCPGGPDLEQTCGTSFAIDGADTRHYNSGSCEPANAGDSCAGGKFCPMGTTPTNVPSCPTGSFSAGTSNQRESDCTACTAGSFCANGSTATGQCSAGSFCLERTIFDAEFSCYAGTSSAAGSTVNAAACSAATCTAGNWCREGQTADNTLCGAAGYKCEAGARQRSTCPAGEHITTGSTCVAAADGSFAEGNGSPETQCPAGYFSASTPANTACTPATAGGYTAAVGATSVTQAGAGLWSLTGDITERSCVLGNTCDGAGNIATCSQGNKCPAGAATETPLVAGDIHDETGLWYDKKCPSGKYCLATAGQAPQTESSGYWTKQGAGVAQANKCGTGYKCEVPTGSIGPYEEACPAGQYTDAADTSTGCSVANCGDGNVCYQSEKNQCPSGFYCDMDRTTGNADPYPEQCPLGTYYDAVAATTGATAVADCVNCEAGKACVVKGSKQSTADCGAGYLCLEAATTTTPNIKCTNSDYTTCTDKNIICPSGYYCPKGTATPQVCEAGKFSNSFGARSTNDCIDCTIGFYCANQNTRTICTGGYFCPAKTSDQTTNPTDAGTFTENGFETQIDCPAGTYQDLTAQGQCKTCPIGSYCDVLKMTAAKACNTNVPGHDCSTAGIIYPRQCKYGEQLNASLACEACPADKYCNANALEAATVASMTCPSGYRCVTGTTTMNPNWTKAQNANFHLCPEGSFCNNALTPVENTCPAGKFMPHIGATQLTDCFSCPSGFYCPTAGLSSVTVCDSGYYCLENSETKNTGTCPGSVCAEECPMGSFCPITYKADGVTPDKGSNVDYKCAPGTYAPTTQMAACTTCEAGTYCQGKGSTATTPCDAGYYCEAGGLIPLTCEEGKIVQASAAQQHSTADCGVGTKNQYYKAMDAALKGTIKDGYESVQPGETDELPRLYGNLCPLGHFCVGGDKTECSAGKYCDIEGRVADGDNCDAGFYCQQKSTSRRPQDLALQFGAICPAKLFCVAGSGGTPVGANCPKGTFSDALGLIQQTECQFCPKGKMCKSEAMGKADLVACPANFYCLDKIDGVTVNEQACDKGHYCAGGNMEGIPCQPGFYQDQTGQSSCLPCLAGDYCKWYYTLPGGVTSQKTTCPAGHQCLSDNLVAPEPCAPGFFQATPNTNVACAKCTAGKFCPNSGTVTPLACPDRHLCIEGTAQPLLCADGKLCEVATLPSQTVDTPCPAGFFCKRGYKAQCMAGYFCSSGASIPMPTDGTTGYICPKGHFCLAGVATTPTPCPIGTFQKYEGASDNTYCITCTGAQQCTTAGLVFPSTKTCPAGVYCSGSTETPCEPGFYCPEGIENKLKCQVGFYQDQSGQASCKSCTAGNYCEHTGTAPNISGAVNPTTCPMGYYCPPETGVYGQNPCPIGYYDDVGGLQASTDCKVCTSPNYCPKPGMTSLDPAYIVQPGYLTDSGAQKSVGSRSCPEDTFCVNGVATTCAAATLSLVTGLSAATECVQCAPGKICPSNSVGIIDCPAGKYCPGFHSSAADPAIQTCDPGHYCPQGSWMQLKCPPGTYQSASGTDSCLPCPLGNFCPTSGMASPTACVGATPIDYTNWFCPVGSIYPTKCKYGEYADNASQCLPCTKGNYCWPDASGATTGIVGVCDWANGYLCRSGAYSPKPLYNGYEFIQSNSQAFLTYNGPVIRGYIATLTGDAQACQAGEFQPSFYGRACQTCFTGRYCPNQAMDDLSAFLCKEGHICFEGLTVGNPVGVTNGAGVIIGDTCPLGYYCSGALIHKLECADGFYSDATGLAICTTCPVGFYCDNVADTKPTACIKDSDCDLGVKRQPLCSLGMYHNTENGLNECDDCTQTNYCRGGRIISQCVAGYICLAGKNTVPNPSIGECPEGQYCPKGAISGTNCPFETMSVMTAARQESDCRGCQPGYVCKWGERKYYPCPKGHWCPVVEEKVSYNFYEYKCPVGTYNQFTKRVYEYECQNCPEGYFCNEEGLYNVTANLCPLGHYCPERTVEPVPCPPGFYSDELGTVAEADCIACPPGSYCPEGNSGPIECSGGFYCLAEQPAMITCPGGYYCNRATNYQASLCPANFYCPRGTEDPIPCDNKHTCGFGTEMQEFCGPGFYVDLRSQQGSVNVCISCPAGTYSSYDTLGCLECPPGFVCYGETNTNRPTIFEEHGGEICPRGHYCPTGSYEPQKCPPGTFNPEQGIGDISGCRMCLEDTFNEKYGQTGCKPCGQFAFAVEGSSICTCNGKNRGYSIEDASCRCLSGFDFLTSDNVSEGNVSDNTDCFPLVFDNCIYNQGNLARGPDGQCVENNDCEQACDGEPGERSLVLGVCTCQNTKNIDDICNQNCRDSAPKVTYKSSYQIVVEEKLANGRTKITEVNLNEVGNVYGSTSCPTGDCNIKTVEMGAQGFEGTYGAPSLVEDLLERGRARRLAAIGGNNRNMTESYYSDSGETPRHLQTAVLQSKIFNPVYCMKAGDSFMFQITNPTHYPQYMKQSIMNSNPSFDYGAFLTLETEMRRQQAIGDITPSIFTFTFTEPGNYVFSDSSNAQKIMIITVMGLGEECADPDRFVQTVSGESLSEIGVSQKPDIILKPNYPLLVSLGLMLFISTAIIMVFIGYCLHKGWSIPDLTARTFRDDQLKMEFHHEEREFATENNDFDKFKSELIDSEEDDLDNFNLDIQQDLVAAGDKYLKMFSKRKHHHINEKMRKREAIKRLLAEIEDLINRLGNSAISSHMQWLDLEDEGADDGAWREKIEKEMDAVQQREKEEDDEYARRKELLLQEASERDKLLFEKAMKSAHQGASQFNKEMLHEFNDKEDQNQAGFNPDMAIYDNGDLQSRNNKYIAAIQNNSSLTEEEKANLLKQQESNLMNIQGFMDEEKKRQQQELDRLLRERLDRRRKLKEKQNKKAIKEETRAAENEADKIFEAKEAEELEFQKKFMDDKVKDLLGQGLNADAQREQIRDLEEDDERKRSEIHQEIKAEKDEYLEGRRAEIKKKFLVGANDEEEMRNELKSLMQGDQKKLDKILQSVQNDKQSQESALKDKMAKRKAALAAKLAQKQQDVEQEIEECDIEQLADQELAADKIHAENLREKLRENAANEAEQSSDKSTSAGDEAGKKSSPTAMQAALRKAFLNKVERTIADMARESEEKRKVESKEKVNKINEDIDYGLQQSDLLSSIQERDANIAKQLAQDDEREQAKLAQRRANLLARRKAKAKNQIEEERIKNQIAVIEEEDQEKAKMSEEYIRNLFKPTCGNASETEEALEKKNELLNEYLSDQFLERMSNLLMKQFTEKEQLLKLLLNKYAEQKATEQENIKKNFAIDLEKLKQLKDHVPEETYNNTIKSLKLNEQNLLREIDLRISAAHKDEEATLRKDFEAKHAGEQVEVRKAHVVSQGKLRKELLGIGLANIESNADQKALDKFEMQKKSEQERRLRNIELKKKTLHNQYENQLKEKFEDYDEMLRRKREEKAEIVEEVDSLQKKIEERKDKLKKQNEVQGMTKEEQDVMLKNLEFQLESLDNAYFNEQRRQELVLKQRMEQRKAKQEKMKVLQEKLKKEEEANISKGMKRGLQGMLSNIIQRKGTLMLNDVNDNSELMRRLRAWKLAKKRHEEATLDEKLTNTEVKLDENEIKIMILKLVQVERLLKDLRKKRGNSPLKQKANKQRPMSGMSRASRQSRSRMGKSALRASQPIGFNHSDQLLLDKQL